MGDRRSIVGLGELTDRGDRSIERREFCKGESDSDLAIPTPLLSLLTRGVAADAFFGVSDAFFGVSDAFFGVSGTLDLFQVHT